MGIVKMNGNFKKHLSRALLWALFLGAALSFASCAKTVRVYQPPRVDLEPYGRLGIITFSDNAEPSVAAYATGQFQNQIHSAQTGIPIVELGTEREVLEGIGSTRLDVAAVQKIGERFDVSAVFTGSLVYADIRTDVDLKNITDFKARVNTTLDATISVKLIETEGGAAVWSDSASWKRNLGKVSVGEDAGISVGAEGYADAYRKLVPDMVRDVTRDFRGRYVKERVNE